MVYAGPHAWGSNIEEPLERFWGKPLNRKELSICDVMGWAERRGPYQNGTWHLSKRAENFNGRIYQGRALVKFLCDKDLERFIQDTILVNFYPFFGRKRMFCDLWRLLHLVELSVRGMAKCLQVEGRLEFAATGELTHAHLDASSPVPTNTEAFMRMGMATWGPLPGNKRAIRITAKAMCAYRPDHLFSQSPLLHALAFDLERQGLMRRETIMGEVIWYPTDAGIQCGLASSEDLDTILASLGYDVESASEHAILKIGRP